MPHYVRRRIQDLLNEQGKAIKGSKVLLLGVTYKPNIADQRESPVRPLAQELLSLGALVSYADPYVKQGKVDSEHGDHPGDRLLYQEDDLTKAVSNSDIVVMLQNHREFDLGQIAASGKAILDTRGIMSGTNISRL
jgi:UDP-N-acetyl-D-mannosaminuronate dehydrogenase